MRLLLALVATGMVVAAPVAAQVGTPPCTFKLSPRTASPPAVVGPDWFIPLVYVQDQPDSPIEIVSIDFDKTELEVSSAGYTKKDDYVLWVRNRSDRTVRRFGVIVRIVPTARLPESPFGFLSPMGFAPTHGPIGPAETIKIRYRNGGGRGTDPHPDGAGYRVVLTVEAIEFDDCYYQPAIVLPKVLR